MANLSKTSSGHVTLKYHSTSGVVEITLTDPNDPHPRYLYLGESELEHLYNVIKTYIDYEG